MNVEQKKGDASAPHGKLTVYAKISLDVSDVTKEADFSPLAEMLRSGFLVAQGNYRDQNSLRDFLKQELGTSLDDEEGMKQFLEGLGGIEGAIDPDKFKEKMNQLEKLDEFIPTPAKMTHFSSEEDILKQEGDVFFAGTFENSANANLAVNAVTILYQSRYRESQIYQVRDQVDTLISEVESLVGTESDVENMLKESTQDIDTREVHVSEVILKKYIPDLIHSISKPSTRKEAENKIRTYLANYPQLDDVEKLITLTRVDHFSQVDVKLIELYSYKISYLFDEEFDEVAKIVKEIKKLEER
jgi:hypothetical protein